MTVPLAEAAGDVVRTAGRHRLGEHFAGLAEFDQFPASVQDELLAAIIPLRAFGPALGRPGVDTLKGSIFANMKELRFRAANGVWRVAFAFDPHRDAILLVAGDKSGVAERAFYKRLIEKADRRFAQHLAGIESEE